MRTTAATDLEMRIERLVQKMRERERAANLSAWPANPIPYPEGLPQGLWLIPFGVDPQTWLER
jgi:hypothetical protein